MKLSENIEKLINKSHVLDASPSPEMDKRIINDSIQEHKKLKERKTIENNNGIYKIVLTRGFIVTTASILIITSISSIMFSRNQKTVEPNDNHSVINMSTRELVPIDIEKIDAEAKAIDKKIYTDDINGLIKILENGMYQSQVKAAMHLGDIGNERALPALAILNKRYGGWMFGEKCVSAYFEGSRNSGVFAAAICSIITRDLSPAQQIEACFDVLEGKGPAAPIVDELFEQNGAGPIYRAKDGDLALLFPNAKLKSGFDVGKCIGAKLSEFDDPSIAPRLRKIENKGSAIYAVWMEVRDMKNENALRRCMEIARNEPGAQSYGAIHCLGEIYGSAAIDALDELALEGYIDAIIAFDDLDYNPEALKRLCQHLNYNQNSQIRLKIVLPKIFESVHAWRENQPEFISAMITALYDPNKDVRTTVAASLRRIANRTDSPLLSFEDDLLIALNHPDKEIQPYILQALKYLGSTRIE